MTGWLPRLIVSLVFTALGAIVAAIIYRQTEGTADGNRAWVFLGALVGLSVAVAWDTWRGQRILVWLRDRADEPAPLGAGLWGEVAYRIERALRKREVQRDEERERLAQFLSAIDASPNGVTLLDKNDAVVWCNATASDHFAIDVKRDHLQRITNVVRAPALAHALSSDEDEATFDGPRGDRRLSVIVRRYGPGLRMLLSSDVTQTEAADTMRTNFVANVSHEIRTPLTVLSGFLESMASLDLTAAERARVLTLMQQQTERMQGLVSDLLTLAKLEGSPRPAVSEWFNLDAVWTLLQSDAQLLSAGRHTMSFDVQHGVDLAGQRHEFVSLVSNLLTNAIHYTPPGGKVALTWRVEQGRGLLQVADNGIGISREHVPRITERFYRVDGSRSRETGGTGLGLAIVKHVAQRHGGELVVDSTPGQGSTFSVSFPAARVRTHAMAVSTPG
jgi:two-component system, OmpR family, phosphate regulon sensor histidine kinase PhoR